MPSSPRARTDYTTAKNILFGLPAAGADIIELGMPFSDPMADGPAVQASSLRALKAGHTMQRTLDLVHAFRVNDQNTPIVLMGYYNPIYIYPSTRFLDEAKAAGVDGLIIVDVPPEPRTRSEPRGAGRRRWRPSPDLPPARCGGTRFLYPTVTDGRDDGRASLSDVTDQDVSDRDAGPAGPRRSGPLDVVALVALALRPLLVVAALTALVPG